ncbi:D-sedoheptulose-7-phosphate isomerase [Thiospirillum jenense]|uniref:Phosphoheptose isomerase n=1 Tax=Thiospirillum jenense TaxID=1653858 RepID=A0A839HDQ7_9GAMM|nr:D-sedoheptulose 7-phosphate isomerase [Thiospirillum jenense]MBB1125149.1 D-sedoheptulose 7-phosphate isomerase [Thiospirillum jenense]
MSDSDFIHATLTAHLAVIRDLATLTPQIAQIADQMWAGLTSGGRIFWLGNGGSAADCQHLAAELVGRFARERPGLASIALTTDTSILTSVANDYGFNQIFARQVAALCRAGDVVMALSTSGNSPNVLRALETAAQLGVTRIGLSGGDGGQMRQLCDHCLCVPATNTARIQEAHIVIGHLWCDLLEQRAVTVASEFPQLDR